MLRYAVEHSINPTLAKQKEKSHFLYWFFYEIICDFCDCAITIKLFLTFNINAFYILEQI